MSVQIINMIHPFIRTSLSFPIDICTPIGSVLAVCGANGSGKTTFLKLLLNDLQPKKGIIRIESKLSYLGVKNGLKLQLTVGQQLPYFKSTELEFPWTKFLNIKYQDLSSGQQRLVSLWLTLHRSETIILLDEPFAHLDENNHTLALGWINSQLDLNKTVILTHHNPEDLKHIKSLQVLDLN